MENVAKGKNIKRFVWIAIALAFMFLFGNLLPAPEGLSSFGWRVLGIFIGCLVLWLTVSTDWASILCLVALAFQPELGYVTVLKSSFGDWIFAFLVCVFAIIYTLSTTPFIKRCTVFFISRKLARRSPWGFLTLFLASAMFLSLFMSPTALFLIFLPIAIDIFKETGIKPGSKTGAAIIMGLVVACSLGMGMTPIAHAFPLLAINYFVRDTGFMIDYPSYMIFGMAVGIIVFAITIFIFKFVIRPDLSPIKNVDVDKMKAELPPMERNEKTALLVFILVILCWLLPGILKFIWPAAADVLNQIGTTVPPMIGVVVLCILTYKGKPIMDIGDTLKNGVPWQSVFIASSVAALGQAMTHPEAGLTEWLTGCLSPVVSGIAPWLFVLLIIVWALLQTNFSSNAVTITVVYTIAVPLALMSNGAVNPAAIACIVGAMSSFAIATPAATAHCAIACGTEWIEVPHMLKWGMLICVAIIIVTYCVGYPILSAILPATY